MHVIKLYLPNISTGVILRSSNIPSALWVDIGWNSSGGTTEEAVRRCLAMAWVVAGVIFGVGGWVGEGKVLGGEREEEKK
jgi:hypothetical protein